MLAPIQDGSYLQYEFRSKDFTGSSRIIFRETGGVYYEVTVDDPKGLLGRPFAKPGRDGKVMVNALMKRRDGSPLELNALGPMWVPFSTSGTAGRANVDFVFSGTYEDEIKEWHRWETFAVTATIFRGAFSGTWYYDTNTGFLVGVEKKTVATSFFTKTPPYWILTDSNIGGLFGPAPSKEVDKKIVTVKPSVEAGPGAGPIEMRDTKFVMLKSGGYIEGVIKVEAEDYVVIEIGGGTITINREDIKEIRDD